MNKPQKPKSASKGKENFKSKSAPKSGKRTPLVKSPKPVKGTLGTRPKISDKATKPQSTKSIVGSKPKLSDKAGKSQSTVNSQPSTKTGQPLAKSRQPNGKSTVRLTKLSSQPKKSSLREVFSELNGIPSTINSQQSTNQNLDLLKYYLVYKPFGMMSQFSKENEKPTLAEIKFDFPTDAYPVGRLDADTEGLLLLTNDTSINNKLLNPKNGHKRTYMAQLDGAITEEAIKQLRKGVTITIDGKAYKTLPAQINLVKEEPALPPRNPPIRVRANIPTSWIELTLIEGKNHQVRKMCAKAGFPVLRLVRIKIGNLSLGNLQPNKVKELTEQEIETLVNS